MTTNRLSIILIKHSNMQTKNPHLFLKYLILSILFVFCFCKNEKSKEEPKEVESCSSFLHLSHIRSFYQGRIKNYVKVIPYKNYEVLCLGGDLDVETTLDTATIRQWDQLFDFGKEQTLWTWGNHDLYDTSLIRHVTRRPPFYTWQFKESTFLILNSELDSSNIIGAQLDLVKKTVAQLKNTKYLFVLTHRLIWMPGNEVLESQIDSITNGPYGNCNECTGPNNFYQDIYPELLKAKAQSIEVFCIAGDIGFKVKEFQFQTPEGIYFMASGCYPGSWKNRALVFEVNHNDPSIEWEFKKLKDL